MKKLSIVFVLVVSVVAGDIPARAGGWAITSLDEIPVEIHAGETYDIGYTILQHGQTPFEGADTYLSIWREAADEAMTFAGRAEGAPGHYLAEVSFPVAGEWSWSVHQDWFGEHDLGQLTISEPSSASLSLPGLSVAGVLLALATTAVLGVFVAQVLMLMRRRAAVIRSTD